MTLKKWSMIAINDVFDELKDENKRLLNELIFADKCLNVFIEYKSFVEMIFTKYSQHFESQDVDYYQRNLIKSSEGVLTIDNQFRQQVIEVKNESNEDRNEDNNDIEFEVNSDHISGNESANEVIGVKSEECDDKSDPDFEPKYEMMSTEDKLAKSKPKSSHKGAKYKPKIETINRRKQQMLSICDFCGHELTSFESRRIHIRKHLSRYQYKSPDPKEKNEYVCDHIGCDYRSKNQNQFIGHLNGHKGNRDFEQMYDMMSTEDKLSKIKPKYKPKVDLKKRREQMLDICDFCGHELTSGESRILHIRKHLSRYYYKSTDPNEKNTYVCDHIGCGYRSTSQNYFIGHLNQHKGVKPFECSSCDKTFPNRFGLKQHIQRFHNLFEQSITCGINGCKKQFVNQFKLNSHRDWVHTKTKIFDCDYPNCGKSFKHFKLLRSHRFVHTTDRPFKCTVNGCAKSCATRSQLNVHMKSHSNNRTIYECTHEECQQTFKTKSGRRKHILQVHCEKKILCDWPGCEYKTNVKDRLISHCRNAHSDVRDYCCDWEGCHMKFKHKTQLMNHLKIHRGEKNYQCHWPGCQYRSVQKCNLDDHVLSHSSDLNYPCDWPDCGKRLKTKRSLKKHIETHTKAK